MTRSHSLNWREARQAMRLVVEVRELGNESLKWKPYLLNGLNRLVGGKFSLAMESPIQINPQNAQMRDVVEVGWENARQRDICRDYLARGELGGDPSIPPMVALRGRSLVMSREQLTDRKNWYASPHVDIVRRNCDSDAFVLSQLTLAPLGIMQFVQITRPWRDRPFGERERRLVGLVHSELGRLWSRDLQLEADNPLHRLSPRLRQALELLRQGDGEKQVAAKLSISRHGVHNLVKRLHQKFNVSTRGELLAAANRCLNQSASFIFPGIARRSGGDDS